MTRRTCCALAVAVLAALEATAVSAGPPPVEVFAAPWQTDDVRLSPNGRYAAAKLLVGGQYVLAIYDLDNIGKVKPVIANPENQEVAWLRWKSDQRLLVSLSFPYQRFGIPTVERRLYGLNADGSNPRFLVPPKKDAVLRPPQDSEKAPVQIADRVVNFLPDDPDHILMAFSEDDPRFPRLYKVDVNNARRELVEKGRDGIFSWTTDQQGRARIGQGYDNDKVREKVFFRPPDGKAWELVIDQPADEGVTFEPVLFDKKDPDILYVESNHEGDTVGLYRYRFSTRTFLDRLFLSPEADIGNVLLDATGTQIHGVTYVLDETKTEWFDPRPAQILKDVLARISAHTASIPAASADYRRVIIYAESPDIPPRYYLYEPGTKQLQYFAFVYPGLDKQPMSLIRTTSFKARDGLVIPAYLSLPPGMTEHPSSPLPAVIFPHGGPQCRDVAAFDPLVQLMTSRGYAVLQINFRGSAGYGAAFMQAGMRQWGKAMQDDVTDGTKWLAASGIADPNRICIVGWSYGGYAALMGAVKEPMLYRCAASIAGVSDLRRLVDSQRFYLFNRVATHYIGDSWKDRNSFADNSPVNHVSAIRVPILLVHGTKDRVVPPVQSEIMAKALDSAGKAYTYVELEDADHSVVRGAERLKLFKSLEAFLAANLVDRK